MIGRYVIGVVIMFFFLTTIHIRGYVDTWMAVGTHFGGIYRYSKIDYAKWQIINYNNNNDWACLNRASAIRKKNHLCVSVYVKWDQYKIRLVRDRFRDQCSLTHQISYMYHFFHSLVAYDLTSFLHSNLSIADVACVQQPYHHHHR